jgi:hypothetical protein
MTNMSKVTITAAAISLVLALGIGAYQAGTWNHQQALPDPSVSPQPTPAQAYVPGTVPPDSPPNYMGNMSAPATAIIPAPGTATATAPMSRAMPPQTSEDIPPGQSTYLTREVPTSATVTQSSATFVSPTDSQTTVVEKKTVVENRPVYRHRIVAHHHYRSDKVHVARAAKHATMFAAKLPGRIRL